MEYPESHKEIVEELLGGRFILSRESHYVTIKENEDFYNLFFKASFNHELQITNEFVRVISDETDENLSRDISIFFAILCYELDKHGKNFLDALQYSEFSIEEVDNLFEETSWVDLVHSNKHLKDSDARKRFIFSSMGKRNIIEKIADDRFAFTAAYKVFIEYAHDLAQNSLDKNTTR
ncbi:MAG TPA: hypothetical protein PKL56_11810 [Cyclobacteriaceae bacterium]|nr:hypothetical protein [Cyclobacteriaceae bacterium]HMV07479.1 hypothetical protein [Cyclobacteriaceae bacterium]HMW99166.1 hypothetical protein [Cyclobacteriaceae bacterium]HMX48201.1 hypothetical protein [Cyclobacteriaceae bacterium]HMY95006.1 hypothetical protein [Cyclobacteriaceae bacterium]